VLAHFVILGTPVLEVGTRTFVMLFDIIIGNVVEFAFGARDDVFHFVVEKITVVDDWCIMFY